MLKENLTQLIRENNPHDIDLNISKYFTLEPQVSFHELLFPQAFSSIYHISLAILRKIFNN